MGVTTLMVTHDQEEALELSDRIVVMSQGKIEQIGTSDDIYYRPQTSFTANFIGVVNTIHAVVEELHHLIYLDVKAVPEFAKGIEVWNCLGSSRHRERFWHP